jgi:alpha/beta superfamily hydrolase
VAQNESFDLAGPAGRLEAVLMRPEVPPLAAGVVCHAHPLHGGMMHYKAVFRAAKALQEQAVAALRFNFRGVGHSEGVHDDGRGEQDDVRAALDELERRFADLPLLLGGFSFGAVMALRVAARDPRPRALFSLGLPLSKMSDTSFLDAIRAPCLFVQGENDAFGGGAQVRALVERLPGPKTLCVLAGADHFFAGRLEQLQQSIAAWAAARPWEAA